jgi:hypothetical protein
LREKEHQDRTGAIAADIVLYLQAMLYELVKFIEIDVGKKLGSQIVDGQPVDDDTLVKSQR